MVKAYYTLSTDEFEKELHLKELDRKILELQAKSVRLQKIIDALAVALFVNIVLLGAAVWLS